MSIDFKLITITYTKDSIGQLVPSETERTVFGELGGITRNEFSSAGALGLKPEFEITMFTYDYNGEEIVEYNSTRYSVYRSYRDGDKTELYLEKRMGI